MFNRAYSKKNLIIQFVVVFIISKALWCLSILDTSHVIIVGGEHTMHSFEILSADFDRFWLPPSLTFQIAVIFGKLADYFNISITLRESCSPAFLSALSNIGRASTDD